MRYSLTKRYLLPHCKHFSSETTQRKFVDKCRVVLRAGNGGKGCLSHTFLSSKRPKSADGGNGGSGGDVVMRATATHGKLDSLNLDSYHVNAAHGGNGSGNAKAGKRGKSKYLQIPVGTMAREILKEEQWSEEDWVRYDEWDSETKPFPLVYGRTIDLCDPDQEYLAAQGGRGGKGNITRDPRKVAYGMRMQAEKDALVEQKAKDRLDEKKHRERVAKGHTVEQEKEEEQKEEEEEYWAALARTLSKEEEDAEAEASGDEYALWLELEAEERANNEHHVSGTMGEATTWELELKTIADVGLVGYPNAGKSTLLSRISRASPKVAPYPFTTLHPYVGITEFRDGYRISVADIPGLVDGASDNAGLGHSFLRHIERTRLLCYVVDVGRCVSEVEPPATDVEAILSINASIERATHQLTALVYELDAYAPGLSQRPSVVIANKMDTLIVPAQYDVEDALQTLGHCVSHNESIPSPVFPISALNAAGIRGFVRQLRGILVTGVEEEDSAVQGGSDKSDK